MSDNLASLEHVYSSIPEHMELGDGSTKWLRLLRESITGLLRTDENARAYHLKEVFTDGRSTWLDEDGDEFLLSLLGEKTYHISHQYGCGTKITNMLECGQQWGGRIVLCDECHVIATIQYPQGWTGYPGDTCRHGVYVGGIGIDHMCGACEQGWE